MILDTGFVAFDPVDLPPTGSGPLNGLTFAAKDVMDVAGHVTGLGNPTWRRTHEPATQHAVGVQALLNAGAHLVGKTHTDELAYSLAGQNSHYGTPPNTLLPGAIPGGSSSGSASVVAAGLVDFAIGTDTGGSIRIPASYCGLFGIRPSHGSVDLTGVAQLAKSFDTLGWLTRSAEHLLAVGEVLLARPAPSKLAITHIALLKEAAALAGPKLTEQTTASRDSANLISEDDLSLGDLNQFFDAFRPVQAYEAWSYFGAWISAHNPEFGPGVRERFALAATVDAATEEAARTAGQALRERLLAWLGMHRVLCLPTASAAASAIDASPETVERVRNQTLRLTAVAGIAGCPQISLPLLHDDRGPVGFSLIGPPGSDIELLELAVRLATQKHEHPKYE